MSRLDKVIREFMQPLNTTLILILGIYTIVWGLWLISPFWTVFSQAPVYCVMAQIGEEWMWGTVAVVTGGFTIRGALKPNFTNLHLGSFLAALHWLLIAFVYLLGDWTSTGGITSLCFFVYAAVFWINVKANRSLYK